MIELLGIFLALCAINGFFFGLFVYALRRCGARFDCEEGETE